MSTSSSCSVQREALAVEALRRNGRVRLRVRGQSMLPSLWPGDIAEIQVCSLREVRPGEIVLAQRDDRFFLHRFLSCMEPDSFLARGDSMPRTDPAYSSGAFLGRLVSLTRNEAAISVPSLATSVSRLLGLFLCYCRPALRLALWFHHWRTAGEPATELPGQIAEASSMQ